jgi:hypothetical protein
MARDGGSSRSFDRPWELRKEEEEGRRPSSDRIHHPKLSMATEGTMKMWGEMLLVGEDFCICES